MQGVHDNYGIMMNGLLSATGVDYAGISFCIGNGASWHMRRCNSSACISSNLGGILGKMGVGYAPLWADNLMLAVIAAACSFAVRTKQNTQLREYAESFCA